MRADFTNATLEGLATHYVGNKHTDNSFFYSEKETELPGAELQSLLTDYFTGPFRDVEEYYEFYHESDLALNAVRRFVTEIFRDAGTLLQQSVAIAKHLFEISDSPQIKSGEMHLAYFKGVYLDGRAIDAIAICKTETRDVFIDIHKDMEGYHFAMLEGINVEKMDKGCIIYNMPDGLVVSAMDKTNKRNEAQYWKDKFLKIIARADEYHHTADYLAAAKDFITKQIPQEYEVSKAQQADYLNRSITFFKNNEEFNEKAFVQDVFGDKELIRSFSGYKRTYEQEHEMELEDAFSISGSAVKRSARVFKSVIKLDKNFHVYVHGDRDLIERGYDEAAGKHYYKIYFDNES